MHRSQIYRMRMHGNVELGERNGDGGKFQTIKMFNVLFIDWTAAHSNKILIRCILPTFTLIKNAITFPEIPSLVWHFPIVSLPLSLILHYFSLPMNRNIRNVDKLQNLLDLMFTETFFKIC